jgi:hypothetical protein
MTEGRVAYHLLGAGSVLMRLAPEPKGDGRDGKRFAT